MQPLSWRRLTFVGLAAALLAWALTMLMVGSGATPLPIPWSAWLACLGAAALTLWLGWQVRRYVHGDRPDLSPLRAARTAVFAQAAAYVGAILAGAYGGYALGILDDWAHGPRRDVIVSAFIACLTGVALLVAGVVAERWCRYGGDDADLGAQRDAEPTRDRGGADPAPA